MTDQLIEPRAFTVFFSWQSDTDSDCNTRLIRNALTQALADLTKESGFLCRLDEATRDEPGSPDIPTTIMRKISEADAHIADLTTINSHDQSESRRVQNPNVLIEVGVGATLLGWGRIILLGNTAFGDFPGDLPFNIETRRATPYTAGPVDKRQLPSITKKLARILAVALQSVITKSPERPVTLKTDPESIQRSRDIVTLNSLLLYLNFDVIDNLSHSAPKRIPGPTFWFWESFNSHWTALTTRIYDSETNELLKTIHQHWSDILSYGEYYDMQNSSLDSTWTRYDHGLDAKEAFTQIEHSLRQLKDASNRLLEHLHKRYIEIDLSERTRASWARWRVQERALASALRQFQSGNSD